MAIDRRNSMPTHRLLLIINLSYGHKPSDNDDAAAADDPKTESRVPASVK